MGDLFTFVQESNPRIPNSIQQPRGCGLIKR